MVQQRGVFSRWLMGGLAAGLCLLAGCNETDLGSMRITIKDDLSGDVTMIQMRSGAEARPDHAAEITGVKWASNATIITTIGTFDSIESITLPGVRFSGVTAGDLHTIRVFLARGPEAKWVALLQDTESQQIAQVAHALEVDAAAQRLGKNVKITLRLPGEGASLVKNRFKGLRVSSSGTEVTLVLPAKELLTPGETVEWTVTW